jgi:exonuclease SbcC
MIEKVTYLRFQPFGKYSLNLSKNITTLVGPSDTGKSSLLRGLRWLAFNRPRGSNFVKHGEESTCLILRYDGKKLTRKKGKKVNTCTLGQENFAALGDDLPEVVKTSLNLSEVNFQRQSDPPFWFSLTPGDLAKALNQVVDLSLIDSTLSSLSSSLKRAQAEEQVCEKRVRELEGKLDDTSWVEDFCSDVQTITDLEARVSEAQKRVEQLATLLDASATAKASTLKSRKRAELCSVIKLEAECLIASQQRACTLEQILRETAKCRELIGRKPPSLGDLEEEVATWQETKQKAESLRSLSSQIARSRSSLSSLRGEATRAAETLGRESQGKCPLCGSTPPS